MKIIKSTLQQSKALTGRSLSSRIKEIHGRKAGRLSRKQINIQHFKILEDKLKSPSVLTLFYYSIAYGIYGNFILFINYTLFGFILKAIGL